ncbi:MAG: hypothetical protein AAGE01_21790 [Pseudomonadota bacterium]
MLCVADYLDALDWVEAIGGTSAAAARSEANLGVVRDFVADRPWIDFLARDPATISSTSVCLTVDVPADAVKRMVALLAEQGVAYDIGAYRDAPPGLRIWCGATVDTDEVRCLMPWIEWAWREVTA